MKFLKFARTAVAATMLLSGAMFANSASASVIVASGDTNLNLGGGQLSTFYSNMFSGSDVFATNGWSVTNTSSFMSAAASTFTIGTLSSAALVGKEWFVASTNTAYSSGDLSIIAAFVANGGNLFVFGEGPSAYADMNLVANSVLAAVGSQMTIGQPQAAFSTWQATASHIGSDSLTAGITTFSGNYAATVSGGTALFTSDGSNLTILAVERINENQVPEPGSLALVGLGMLGLLKLRRKV